MPTTTIIKKKKTYRKRYGRNRRKFRKLKKKVNHGAYIKLRTIGMPYNMITFLRFMSKQYSYTVPQLDPSPGTGSPFWTNGATAFVIGLNHQNPLNLQNNAPVPKPYLDNAYFGPTPTVSTEGALTDAAPSTFLYSQLTWWANWYRRMRITHVWVKTTIRPVQEVTGIPGYTVPTGRDPFSVTVFDSKYIDGINAPQSLMLKDLDDIRCTRGAKTMMFSGQRSKPIVLYRKISIKKLLGVKDLKDTGYETQCGINTDLSTPTVLTNPTVRNACFEFIRIDRVTDPDMIGTAPKPLRFSIQFNIVAKAHFSQLNPNDPRSLIDSTLSSTGNEDPDSTTHNAPAGTSGSS